MKITLFVNLSDKQYGFYKDVEKALLKKHEVETYNDRDFEMEKLIESANKSDMFLFAHGGVYTDTNMNFSMSLERLKQILIGIKVPKVMWFPDKVWFLNDQMMEELVPMVNLAFFNDDTWVRRHKFPNVFSLRMGASEKKKGKYRKEYDVKVAFVGTPYGFRRPYLDNLRQQFGNKFKILTNCYGDDFLDLCASAKVIFVPVQPNDDFYWDNRIYETLSAGGFLVYPDLYGLKEEGFVKGEHFAGYKSWDDLMPMLNDYLEDEESRKKISKQGKEFAKNFTWENRLDKLFEIYESESKR